MFDAVALSLAADLSRGLGWLPTYKPHEIWPCDHAPALSALRLHTVLRSHAATERASDALEIRLLRSVHLYVRKCEHVLAVTKQLALN